METFPLVAPGLIHAAIVGMMAERISVAKDGTNQKQNYKFRRVDDVFEALQSRMAYHSIHVYPHRIIEDTCTERPGKDGGVIIHVRQRIEFRFCHAQDGSFIPVETTGEGMDYGGDKASNKAMSAALKYALVQTFLIVTGEPSDSENESPEVGRRPARPSRPLRPPPSEPQAPPPDPASGPEMVAVMTRAASGLWVAGGEEPRLLPNQQARLKILQKELGVEDRLWREKLFEWCGKSSSADLSDREAEEWAVRLERSKAARAKSGKAADAPT